MKGRIRIELAILELKLDALLRALERFYRPDQPRAPRGTPIGGQWVRDEVLVAGGRCDGFSAGCQNGGSFGSSGSVRIGRKLLCWDCAIKYLGIQNLTPVQQLDLIRKIDPSWR